MTAFIDWEEQWASFAPEFREGRAHIKLPKEQTLSLAPGPGFGDFSHPTTRLMVDLMTCFVQDEIIYDIGCGSGILALAAGKLGAKQLFICDINSDAIDHAKLNAKINQIAVSTEFPIAFSPVVFMNMISCEQKEAWKSHRLPFKTLITSGILSTEKKNYLSYAYEQGWQLLHEACLEGWLGFVFKEKR